VTKKSRKGGLLAIVSAITVVGIVLAAPSCQSDEPKRGPVEVTKEVTIVPRGLDTVATTTTTVTPQPVAAPVAPKLMPAKPAPTKPKVTTTTPSPRKPQYVIVDKGGPVPNIEPPTKLWVRGLTAEECDGMGGTYDGSTGLCRNVDY
jgi:hypothetical protein